MKECIMAQRGMKAGEWPKGTRSQTLASMAALREKELTIDEFTKTTLNYWSSAERHNLQEVKTFRDSRLQQTLGGCRRHTPRRGQRCPCERDFMAEFSFAAP